MRLQRSRQRHEREQPPEQRVGEAAGLRQVRECHERDRPAAKRARRMRRHRALQRRDALAERHIRNGRRSLGFLFLLIVSMTDDDGKLAHAALRIAQERLQFLREIGDRRIAFFPVGIEREEYHVVDGGVQLVPAQRRQHQLRVFDGDFSALEIGRQKRVLARQHLVRQRRQRPFVAAHVEVLLAHLLQGHVPDGATASRAVAGRVGQRGQAEVGDFHLALMVDQHVVGLDVEVQHLVGVRHLQRMGHRREHGSHHIQCETVGVTMQQLGERDAFDVLHDEVGGGLLHLEIVHRDDARIRQHCRGARLVQAGNVRERMYQRPVAYQVEYRSRIPFGFVGIVENGIVFPGKRLVLRRALRDGVRPRKRRARGVHLIQLDAFDGHLALDARVPRHPHGAEAAGFRFADGSIPVQYELSIACHAPIIGQAAADAHASCRNACLAQKP